MNAKVNEKPRVPAIAAAAFWFAACACMAADAPKVEPKAEPAKEEKHPSDEEAFNFVRGDRRDPFAFTKALPQIRSTIVGPNGSDGGTGPMNPQEIQQKQQEALACYVQA